MFLAVPATAEVKWSVNTPEPIVFDISPKNNTLELILELKFCANSVMLDPVNIFVLPAVTPSLSLSISKVTVETPSPTLKLVLAPREAWVTSIVALDLDQGVTEKNLG